MNLENDAPTNYVAGAGTALSYMAELGTPESQIVEVAKKMDVCFESIDESDKERLIAAYGKLPEQG
ncbi:hypothetical protein [Aliagarivorans taiwanensis]|uniref:hypothetical protein n=1 Tax=Aliagarivorans taiwanensis TaxID=561966 RepID=UPI000424EB35|nr:hypothetical protein [Aliagarivorans taiwanensis]